MRHFPPGNWRKRKTGLNLREAYSANFPSVYREPAAFEPLSPFLLLIFQADVEVDVAAQPKKRTFKKFSFRGVDLDALLDMSTDELVKLFSARARRRYYPFLFNTVRQILPGCLLHIWVFAYDSLISGSNAVWRGNQWLLSRSFVRR